MKDRIERITNTPPWLNRKHSTRKRALNLFITIITWIGITVLFYIGFSLLFDTLLERELKVSYKVLEREYSQLSNRYDSIERALQNLEDRDLNVFNALFESEPIDIHSRDQIDNSRDNEQLLRLTNKELGELLISKTSVMQQNLSQLDIARDRLIDTIISMGSMVNNIPSIQPIINKQLTLLTASFGLRIHPFYKSLVQHNGIDYTTPEGSRVFATGDGIVRNTASKKISSTGISITIDHQNGYKTVYNHLSKVTVKKGQKVRRGDIIALTGNSGLSLSPHLHYEIIYNGEHIDPIHYFSDELTPDEYSRIMEVAQRGMQSFD